MNNLIIGIDSGQRGAAVAVDSHGKYQDHILMPWSVKTGWEWDVLSAWLSAQQPVLIAIEIPQLDRPKQRGRLATAGGYWGPVVIANLLGIPVLSVEANSWQSEIMAGAKYPGDPKRAARIVAELRYGAPPYPWSEVRNRMSREGVIDAYLIACWGAGRNNLRGKL